MTSDRAVVVDASVAICLLLGEPGQPQVIEALHRWSSQGRRRVVPSQFWLEVANRLLREPGMSGEAVLRDIHRLDTYGLETVDVDRPTLLTVIDLVERFRLTAYDALYLAVAQALDAELATLDTALAAAAGDRAAGLGEVGRLNEQPAPYEHQVTWPRYKELAALMARLRAEVDRPDVAPVSVRSTSPR